MSDSRELAFAKELAEAAGTVMRKHFRSNSIGTTFKADKSPLTIADTTINQMVLDAVKKEFPDHTVISEEGSLDQGGDYRWLCDPVDGTLPYSLGMPISSFTLALAHKGRVMLGVIYDPFGDRLMWSQGGKGAFLNGTQLQQSSPAPGSKLVANIEVWDEGHARFLEEFKGPDRVPLCLCSVAYSTMLVASGAMQLVVFSGKQPWDTAAASLIITEAGGRVSDLHGRPADYSAGVEGFLGAHPAVYDEALAMVRKARIWQQA